MKDKVQTITFGGALLFLLCYFVELFGFPNELVVVLGGILCLVLLIQQKKFRIDAGILLLTLTMVSYYVIVNGVKGLFYSILYIPLVIYVLTNYTVHHVKNMNPSEELLLHVLMTLVMGFSIHGILNSYLYYAGYVLPGTRKWMDIWSQSIMLGTHHTAFFLPTLVLIFPALLFRKKRKATYGLVLLTAAFFFYTSLATRTRMSLVIVVLVCGIQMILYAVLDWKTSKKILLNKKVWVAGIIAIAIAAIAVWLLKDTAVISAFVKGLGKDGGILNNVRFEAQRDALSQLFTYPMGGRQMEMRLGNYAHNVWLDMANAAGLIPFFAFVAYTLFTMYEMVLILRKDNVSIELKLIIIGFYSAFFLYFMVEPALDASVHLVTPWIFVNGLVHGSLTMEKNS